MCVQRIKFSATGGGGTPGVGFIANVKIGTMMEELFTYDNIKDVVIFLLAIWGAVLSTINWRQNTDKNKRCIKVTASTAMPAYETGDLGDCYAEIKATNTGHRSVTVNRLFFELPDKATLVLISSQGLPGVSNPQFPVTLADGESVSCYISYRDIASALVNSNRSEKVRLTPVCEDSASGVYKGEAWDVDPAEFSKM